MNTNNKGWFYGSQLTSDSDVAFATDITDISQINDASIFSFGDNFNGSHCDAECDSDGVGEFLIWRNIHTGHYGALRIDDINVLDLNLLMEKSLEHGGFKQTDLLIYLPCLYLLQSGY